MSTCAIDLVTRMRAIDDILVRIDVASGHVRVEDLYVAPVAPTHGVPEDAT